MTTPTPEDFEANPFDYSAEVWALFNAAPHAGEFPAGEANVATGQAGTPAARSVLRVQFKFDGDRVAAARFRAYGCPTSIAVGAWIASWAAGKSAIELAGLTMKQLRDALEITDDRAHCALLGEDAVKAALASRLKQEAAP